MKLDNLEKGIIAICRLNKLEKKLEINKTWRIGKLQINYNWCSSKNLWGRFGGGWNWELGIQVGGKTVILNCLIFKIRFDIIKEE